MSNVFALRSGKRAPFPLDAIPKGGPYRVLVEPTRGGWLVFTDEDDGFYDLGIHNKREALRIALSFVERFNCELELYNRPFVQVLADG